MFFRCIGADTSKKYRRAKRAPRAQRADARCANRNAPPGWWGGPAGGRNFWCISFHFPSKSTQIRHHNKWLAFRYNIATKLKKNGRKYRKKVSLLLILKCVVGGLPRAQPQQLLTPTPFRSPPAPMSSSYTRPEARGPTSVLVQRVEQIFGPPVLRDRTREVGSNMDETPGAWRFGVCSP